ncbi:winged helix-turn-helix domain-containing protein [Cognatishimia maritima]|uniref:winged helix-turn-helix domain-containing protein n=1 Tax=Cognatishimia maritima TaxID=870908 RepID=UPI0013F4C349|nr:winged helix-turn-helix domain-containing protein [Cognatishimia maritima]
MSTAYAYIIDSDPGMALSLRHLFGAICDVGAEIFQDPASAVAASDGARPPVVILGRVADREDHIAALKSAGFPFVMVIDRRDSAQEAERALLAGADDVIGFPFSLRLLALRLRARVGLLDSPEGLEILQDSENWDDGAYIASRAGLTSAEAQVAHILISHAGEIVSRDELSYAIDHRPWDYGDRKFDVHVAKIRKKLTAVFGEHITVNTVRSAGYTLTIDEMGMQRLMR